MEKLRAVIYNRCSTEEESQKDALAKQVRESKECVSGQGWELADTYVEAKSGTTSKGRSEYNRLYQDLETDKFDIIVIKSQDRLMRNTKDWYLFLDRMQKNGKRLFMYLDHKFYTPDDALVTGIKAILAEEYSRELSKKINNAHRNRQKEGKSFVFTNQTYGYRKLADKSVVVEEEEAGMIKMIYELSANGYGTHCSAEILYQNGYRNRKGKRISPSLVRNIIRNPIYRGNVVQNRQHYDFESRKVHKNPQSEWVIHENAIPAIVDEDLFDRANRGLDARRQGENQSGISNEEKNTGRYDFTGKLFCGLCGNLFYRTIRQNKDGKVAEWKCRNYLLNGRKNIRLRRDQIRKVERKENEGCDNVHLSEKKLYGALERLCGGKRKDPEVERKRLLDKTLSFIRRALMENNTLPEKNDLRASLNKLSGRRRLLLNKLLDGVVSDEDYKAKNQELQNKIEQAKARLERLEDDGLQNVRLERRIETIRVKLEGGLLEQAQIAARMGSIKKIEVYPAYLEIYVDSCVTEGLFEKDFLAVIKDVTDGFTMIRIPQTCSTSRQADIEEERERVLELMRRRPGITAKEIAEEMGVNLSRVRSRMRELK